MKMVGSTIEYHQKLAREPFWISLKARFYMDSLVSYPEFLLTS